MEDSKSMPDKRTRKAAAAPPDAKRPSAKPAAKRPVRKRATSPNAAAPGTAHAVEMDASDVLAWLERHGSKQYRATMTARYGIPSENAYGVPVGAMLKLGKQLGANHALAAALWATGRYEARMVASYVDDPSQVTAAQMDRWCRDFDSWAICDTVCWHLFERTPHAWSRIAKWSSGKDEFARRAAFALLACLALHDKEGDDAPYARALVLVERAATDDRNFVKKAVNWALRAIGRRGPALHEASIAVAQRLAAHPDATARWVGSDALRKLEATPPRPRARPASKKSATRPSGRWPND